MEGVGLAEDSEVEGWEGAALVGGVKVAEEVAGTAVAVRAAVDWAVVELVVATEEVVMEAAMAVARTIREDT